MITLEQEKKSLTLEMTRSGKPAVWERGGGYTNTGNATIVATNKGTPPVPYYVRRRGELANGHHALMPIMTGWWIIEADHHRGDFIVEVWQVSRIKDGVVDLLLKYKLAEEEWTPMLPDFLLEACKAAIEKAQCYHCREPHFTA